MPWPIWGNGDTYARIEAGFEVSVRTVWRYLRQAVDLLAACADDLAAAMRRAVRLAYAILDGHADPGRRQRLYYSGKHKRHGVNVQVLADPAGLWASAALPGSTHDLTAVRIRGLIDAFDQHKVPPKTPLATMKMAQRTRSRGWMISLAMSPSSRASGSASLRAPKESLVTSSMRAMGTW